MEKKYVPLISSGVAGPLGILHLPRLWQKCLLKANKQLADGYPDIGSGYDAMVLGALNLDPDAVRTFIAETKSTYPAFEAWIKARPGVKLGWTNIDKSNRAILGYNHDDPTRAGILKNVGVVDHTKVGYCAIDVNNLEDWNDFHKELLAPAASASPPLPQTQATPAAEAAAPPKAAADSAPGIKTTASEPVGAA